MKILFKYSYIYDKNLDSKGKFFSYRKIENSIKIMNSFWDENKEKIERYLEEIAGLNFQEKEITCYINSSKSFSDPLSLKIENYTEMKDVLIHELIHILLTQNQKKIKKGWDKFIFQFKKESHVTRVHIMVHSIHLLVAEKITPKRLKRIREYSKDKEYIRSWEIVEKETPQKIINYIKN